MKILDNHLQPEHLIAYIAQHLDTKYRNKQLSTSYAWWMLEEITKQSKTTLLTHSTMALSSEQYNQLHHWIDQQVDHHVPLAYLLGRVPFGDIVLHVEPPILIPRPETEAWCYALIKKLQKLPDQSFSILDIGTGSGCIAIALAQAFPQATIYATDISLEALELAKKNAHHNNISSIHFIHSHLFEQLPAGIRFDVIVSNPPYIAQSEWETLDASVRIWEDRQALIAAENGLHILHTIISQAPSYIKANAAIIQHHIPQLLVEIGYQQGDMVTPFFKAAGFQKVHIEKDLAGLDRIVTGYNNYVVQPLT